MGAGKNTGRDAIHRLGRAIAINDRRTQAEVYFSVRWAILGARVPGFREIGYWSRQMAEGGVQPRRQIRLRDGRSPVQAQPWQYPPQAHFCLAISAQKRYNFTMF